MILVLAFFWGFLRPSYAVNLLYENFQGSLWNPPQYLMYQPDDKGSTFFEFNDTVHYPAGVTQSLGAIGKFYQPSDPSRTNGLAQVVIASQYAPGANKGNVGSVKPFNAKIGGKRPAAISLELYASITTTFYFYLGDVNNTCLCGPGQGNEDWQTQEETAFLDPVTIPSGIWTNVTLPIDKPHWDNNLDSIDWTQITQVFIEAIGPPCGAAIPAGGLSEEINYGPISFLGSMTYPTPTPANTPSYVCPTGTMTSTPTFSPTKTPTPTPGSPVPVLTFTPTPTPPPGLKVWPNPFTPGVLPNEAAHFLLPGGHSAGHLLIADLKRRRVRSFDFGVGGDVQWDGKDDGGNSVPSGVYLYLLELDGTVSRGTVTVMR